MVRILGRCLPMICMPRKKRQSFPICEQQTNGTKHQNQINKLFVRRVESIRVTHQGIGLKRLPLQTIKERQSDKKKTKSKDTRPKLEKVIRPDDTEFDCETHISDRESEQKHRTKSKKKSSSPSNKEKPKETKAAHSRTPLEKLFKKTKKAKTPSPVPSNVIDIPEEEEQQEEEDDGDGDEEQDEDHDDTSSISSTPSTTSDWSTTTYPDSQSSMKSDEETHRRQSMPVTCLKNQNRQMKHRSCVESFYLGKELVPPCSSSTKTKVKNSPSEQNKRTEVPSSAKSKQVLQNVRNMMKDHTVQEQHFNDTRQRESVRL